MLLRITLKMLSCINRSLKLLAMGKPAEALGIISQHISTINCHLFKIEIKYIFQLYSGDRDVLGPPMMVLLIQEVTICSCSW